MLHNLGCCGGTSGGTSATSGGATGTSGAGGTSAGGEIFLGRFRVTRHDICDVVVRTGELVQSIAVRPSLALSQQRSPRGARCALD